MTEPSATNEPLRGASPPGVAPGARVNILLSSVAGAFALAPLGDGWWAAGLAAIGTLGLLIVAWLVRSEREGALQRERELLASAFHDPLTGLANRALLLNRLSHTIAQGQRPPSRAFAVLFLDIDHFKAVNDTLGHAAGDALLRVVAERLESCVRPSDTLARFGGDEFVILAHDLGVGQAAALAGRMLEAACAPASVMGHDVVPSVSIGLAPGGPGYLEGLDLLRDADSALYRAKREGRGRVCVYTEAMHTKAVERLNLEHDLRHAIGRGEMEVEYQPIMDMQSARIRGFEALLRWRHDGALIPPERFLPVAEETGELLGLTWWLLEQACRTGADWRRRGLGHNLPMQVTFNGLQLSERDPVGAVLTILARAGLPADAVHLELTEASVLKPGATAVLEGMRAAGIPLILNHFGTGYASMSCLHEFRFDVLKIDGSFIHPLTDPSRRNMVAAVIQLARGLGMDVAAEGVETETQAASLLELGCPHGQGHLWSRALPSAEASELLTNEAARRAS